MSIKIIIELGDDQKINISGPLENKVLCYGLLEMGKDLVRDYKAKMVITPSLVGPGVVTPLGSN